MSTSDRKQRYKNAALDSQELRRRREEEGIQLRKAKREEQIFKKRNVDEASDFGIFVKLCVLYSV